MDGELEAEVGEGEDAQPGEPAHDGSKEISGGEGAVLVAGAQEVVTGELFDSGDW